LVRTDIQQYNASYISGYDRLPSEIERVINKGVDVSNEHIINIDWYDMPERGYNHKSFRDP